jgi:hypothetical protein
MPKLYYSILTLILLLSLTACEEKLEEIGDPKNIIGGNTETFVKTIYANYDSVIAIDTNAVVSSSRLAYGHKNDNNILTLLRFNEIFPDDSILSFDSASVQFVADYVIGDYPVTTPMRIYEFTESWTSDEIRELIRQRPDDISASILELTSGEVIADYPYLYSGPDTVGNNSRGIDDTIRIDLDPDKVMAWYEDVDWQLKGILLYPDQMNEIMFAFYTLGTDVSVQLKLSYQQYIDEDSILAVVDTSLFANVDIAVYDGEAPQWPNDQRYYITTGFPNRIQINFDYESLPARAIILNARMQFPVDANDSFFAQSRANQSLIVFPLIPDENGDLIYSSSVTRTYFLDEINNDYNEWSMRLSDGGFFASEIVQQIYNGIQADPDSLFIRSYWVELNGFVDDFSYLNVHSHKSVNQEMLPRIVIEYFIPPESRY